MEQQNPPLLRPIPRRPFGLNLTGPTPPSEDSNPSTPAPPDLATTPQLLNPHVSASGTISRSQSSLNLTSSALFGIFGALSSNRDDPFRDDPDDGPTGAQTPVRRPDLDEKTYALLRERSRALRDGLRAGEASPSGAGVVLSLCARTGLLFLLGMGYGALVARLRGARSLSFDEAAADALRWGYLAGWGVSGVALGALLPWFDGVWQTTFGGEGKAVKEEKKAGATGTDWSHVVRSIGAFVGIVFALVWNPHPPFLYTLSSSTVCTRQLKLSAAQTPLGLHPPSFHGPRPRKPLPLVSRRRHEARFSPLRSCRPNGQPGPARNQPGRHARAVVAAAARRGVDGQRFGGGRGRCLAGVEGTQHT